MWSRLVSVTTCAAFAADTAHAVYAEASAAAALSTESLAAAHVAEYDAFRAQIGRSQREESDESEYVQRLHVYLENRRAVEAHNARPGASWKAELNRFADLTPEERRSMFGYRRTGSRPEASDASAAASFLELRERRQVADSKDWRTHLNSSRFLREQGECGSCWAVAAAGALEMHSEMVGGPARRLSYEQLVDCVDNPRHCGGQGGCKGATAELAFEYVQKHGLGAAEDYRGYQTGGDGKCKPASTLTKIGGFTRLPENKVQPLLEAIAYKGPVVVSVDAAGWSFYRSGVYDGCAQNATVNHAVLLVGYGVDQKLGKKYWLIRNSWGRHWGEDGYIRLLRHDSDEGDAGYCGTDHDPQQGVGCDGGPSTIPVCGMCGVLSDSSYPRLVSPVQ